MSKGDEFPYPPPRGVRYWIGGWWAFLGTRFGDGCGDGCAYCGSALPHLRRFCDEALYVMEIPWETDEAIDTASAPGTGASEGAIEERSVA